MIKNKLKLITIGLMSAALAACGGAGGSSNSDSELS